MNLFITANKKGQTTTMTYVGRGGEKLDWALNEFSVTPKGLVCCDLGSNVGGFVDCLLQHGATKVYSVDTSYGTLAWTLRNDQRVIVMERTNALHVELPEKVDLVTCDVGWTRQEKVIPKAVSLLNPQGKILSLLKPQYEARREEMEKGRKGKVKEESLKNILERVCNTARDTGLEFSPPSRAPFLGGKGKNPEFYFLLERR